MVVGDPFFDNIEADIERILLGYVKVPSFTNTGAEKEAEEYFIEHFSNVDYFMEHPESYGSYKIEGDHLDRAVGWAMVKGKGNGTVVFIHHCDVVSNEDFKQLKEYAFSPYELQEKLMDIKDSLNDESRDDLEGGEFLFGRGTCDMKGGGAIQIALTERYSRIHDTLNGNIIILSLPDEENMSAGMRSAVTLLKELKDKYSLDYRLMINSEPHQRKEHDTGVFSTGSVGKLMPFIYVRGFLAHAGKVFEGFNPLNVLCEIVRNTETSRYFSDILGNEASPPPTWLFLKDGKESYNVSMPLSAYGYFSILTLKQGPGDILEKVKIIARRSFEKVLNDMNENYDSFCFITGRKMQKLPWEVKITGFAELCREAEENVGDSFKDIYNAKLEELSDDMQNGASVGECGRILIDWLFDYISDLSPRVVYGFIPPYYPHVSNIFLEGSSEIIKLLPEELKSFAAGRWEQKYEVENHYTGISDLSYSGIAGSSEIDHIFVESMPFWGTSYNVHIDAIEQISMPCINIGPWGKDFHKMTERVYKEDLYSRIPLIIKYAADKMLSY